MVTRVFRKWDGMALLLLRIQLPEPTARGAILRAACGRVNSLLSSVILASTLGVPTTPGGARHAAESLRRLARVSPPATGAWGREPALRRMKHSW